MERLVELTSQTPAKLYGLYPRKGSLTVGADADIVLLDTGVERTLTASMLHEKTDYTPFEGVKLHVGVDKVLSNGRVVIDGAEDHTAAGTGNLLERGLPQSARRLT